MGVENLKRILIPIPPLKIQQNIVKHMTILYKEASDLQQLSPYYQRAISKFETQIFE
ncbi:restriction endonuclease subunit S [Bacteroides fragilis]